MKVFLTTVIAIVLFILPLPVEVKTAGELKKIMQEGNLSAHISLDTVLTTPHIYGLGPADGIKGELLIIDSKAFWCKVENGKINTSINNNAKAAMLLYALVPAWKSVTITDEVKDYAALEKLVEKYSLQNGQSLEIPFPFIIKGIVDSASWHVINWKDGVTHTFDNHKQFAKYGSFNNEAVTFLGFYSNKHHSIFTHHTTNMHIHAMDKNKTTVGHLEELLTAANTLTLLIPNNT